MRAEAATYFFKGQRRQEIPKEHRAASARQRDGEFWRVVDGVPSVAGPKREFSAKSQDGVANEGQPAATLNLDGQDIGAILSVPSRARYHNRYAQARKCMYVRTNNTKKQPPF